MDKTIEKQRKVERLTKSRKERNKHSERKNQSNI